MRQFLFIVALLITTAVSAQIPKGEYRVITWQYATSEKVISDGVFEPEQSVILKVSDYSITLFVGGYPALIVLQGEWKNSGSMWYAASMNVKDESPLTIFSNKTESLENGWMFSVYHSNDAIERFGVVGATGQK